MAWIKRNLLLVVSGVVALALLGLGGWYFWSARKQNQEVNENIERTKKEIADLLGKPVTPTKENLAAAKQEGVRLNQFIADARKMFPASPAPTEALTPINFKSLLARTVNDLHQQASGVGIKIDPLPDGKLYYFTFENQRLPVNFPPESLRPLSERLHEVQFIADVLFKSRINRLVGMKRAMVAGERPTGGAAQPGGTGDYLATGARTNAETSMALWPYEVVFDSFTSELAAVIEGLQNAKMGLVVKEVRIEPADEKAWGAPPPVRGNPPGQPGLNPPPGRRGGGNPPGVRGGGAAVPPGAPGPSLVTIINEKLVRVTMRIEVIKPEPFGFGGPGGNFPGRGGRGGPPSGGSAAP